MINISPRNALNDLWRENEGIKFNVRVAFQVICKRNLKYRRWSEDKISNMRVCNYMLFFLCVVEKGIWRNVFYKLRFNALFEAKEFRVILFARFTSIFLLQRWFQLWFQRNCFHLWFGKQRYGHEMYRKNKKIIVLLK